MDPNTRTLLVYFSRTGTTREVARTIAGTLGCDVEELVDARGRYDPGFRGYHRALRDAFFGRRATLGETTHDPTDYDLVIVATPTWCWSLSAPVRAYLAGTRGRLAQVAFVVTCGGIGGGRVLRQMAAACGLQPVATLVLTGRDLWRGEAHAKTLAFARALQPAAIAARAA